MRTTIITILFFFTTNYLLGQTDTLSDKDYSVYNYLIVRIIENRDSISRKYDTNLNHLNYQIGINTYTKGNKYGISLDSTEKYFTLNDFVNYFNLNKKNYPIDIKKIKAKNCTFFEVDKESKTMKMEFSKCYFFNNNKSVMVYQGVVYGPLDGEGCMYILQLGDDNNWKIIIKEVVWVS
ncbi:MAG TPA: hypothetical protein VK783_02230 [Bacteroidia bacterium]|jgi:hypothetical protein|nr:hypothetical protein [Bacteroidia bacterium]